MGGVDYFIDLYLLDIFFVIRLIQRLKLISLHVKKIDLTVRSNN